MCPPRFCNLPPSNDVYGYGGEHADDEYAGDSSSSPANRLRLAFHDWKPAEEARLPREVFPSPPHSIVIEDGYRFEYAVCSRCRRVYPHLFLQGCDVTPMQAFLCEFQAWIDSGCPLE